MSKTRTVSSITSRPQNGQRQEGEQVVNWGGGRDQNGTKRSHFVGADGNSLSIGYRLGGGDRSGAGGKSAIATDTNTKTEKMQKQNRSNTKPEGTGGRGDGEGKDRGRITTGLAERNKPKVPIEEYYAQKGVNLSILRKTSKVRYGANPGSKNGAKITVDHFNPPKGYTMEDLPDSQGSNHSMEEQPVSPAVLLASQCRREKRTAPKMSSDEIIQRLKKGRENKKENVSSPAISSKEGSSSKKSETAPNPLSLSLNGSFPDDSFNENELILASQQVEDDLAASHDALTQPSSVNDVRKRDINGNAKNMGKFIPAAASNMPFATSTPNPSTSRNSSDSNTPRTRSFGLSRIVSRTKSSTLKSNSSSSIFENSSADVDLASPVTDESDIMENGSGATPRKILRFEESPIKPIKKGNSECGGFFDDEDDHIFSQVVMPEASKENKEKDKSDKSTVVMAPIQNENDTMESESMDESDYAAILQLELEALNCHSASTSGNSSGSLISAPTRSSEKRHVKTTNAVQPETPVTRSRRQGLSRRPQKKY